MNLARVLLALAGAAFATGATAACKGTTTQVQADATSGAGGSTTQAATASSSATTSTSTGAGGETPACAAAEEAIAQASTGTWSCTAVVRLDYVSYTPLGFQIVCGPYTATTDDSARATAQADTGFGQSGTSLAGASATDERVFWQAAADFGGAASVSARSGRSTFGGSIVWAGAGDITYPETWKPASALGVGCGAAGLSPPTAHGFDLGSGQPLSAADVAKALAPVWETALPAGLGKIAYLFDAVVLLYPRTVGALDPTTAEWIVLLDTGWLE